MAQEDQFSEAKLLAKAIEDIVSTRAKFWEAGQAFILSKHAFLAQWETVDNWYTASNTKKVNHFTRQYFNCRLNQDKNLKLADKKPEGYVNPSGRELSFQKHYECSASVSVRELPDGRRSIQVQRGHCGHTMDDSDTHKKSASVQQTVQELLPYSANQHFGRQG